MKSYQKQFIEIALKANALKFGKFTLKSGRISPYFFNISPLLSAEYFIKLGEIYAAAIIDANLQYDILFGPAYKGIPLICTTSIALQSTYKVNKSFSFNRKEIKDHGEGGQLIGSNVHNKKILLIDDVITAGTAKQESIEILRAAHAKIAGIVIALDRQERGLNNISAADEISRQYQIPVISIITLEEIISYLSDQNASDNFTADIIQYRQEYGCTDNL